MKADFSDFFGGLIHIFVIIMPGGILLAVLFYVLGDWFAQLSLIPLNETYMPAIWFLAIAASFILGHLISLAASWEEDKSEYKTGEVNPALRIIAGKIVRSKIADVLIKEDKVRRWSVALLREKGDLSCRDIERKDADRRFFRNIRVVLSLSFIIFVIHCVVLFVFVVYNSEVCLKPISTMPVIILIIPLRHFSQRRYKNQDKKFTQLVFESLFTAFPQKLQHDKTIYSYEMRWFSKEPFTERVGAFIGGNNKEPMRDYYFNDISKKVGIKLRNGKMEIKSRLDVIEGKKKDLKLPGSIELWKKQSFRDPEALSVILVNKIRNSRLFLLMDDGELDENTHQGKHHEGPGCVVELTEITICDRTKAEYWTVAIEGFGTPGYKQLEAVKKGFKLLTNGFCEKDRKFFNSKRSYGYPEWLVDVKGKEDLIIVKQVAISTLKPRREELRPLWPCF